MPSEHKNRFISYELGLLTIKAALSTRDKEFTVYKETIKSHQRTPAKEAIREVLDEIEIMYSPVLFPEDHAKHIENTAKKLTDKIGKYLKGDRFRIGITQKLINMHLKYLWCSNLISEPPHCPIDGIIRDKAKICDPSFSYDWIKSDCIEEYKSAVISLENIAKKRGKSIAQWELHEFKRRNNN
ncbi:hypothetical protein [Alcanivorax sp. 24]|uniref:hypothetical protein n=1 Tax=Alcanivorax sp. 24 TaxID=2545266 RepID=UPI00105FB2EE|nr:hypothetical protein [Alcanivorax sp. 24]